jgi:hypothetical protein
MRRCGYPLSEKDTDSECRDRANRVSVSVLTRWNSTRRSLSGDTTGATLPCACVAKRQGAANSPLKKSALVIRTTAGLPIVHPSGRVRLQRTPDSRSNLAERAPTHSSRAGGPRSKYTRPTGDVISPVTLR